MIAKDQYFEILSRGGLNNLGWCNKVNLKELALTKINKCYFSGRWLTRK